MGGNDDKNIDRGEVYIFDTLNISFEKVFSSDSFRYLAVDNANCFMLCHNHVAAYVYGTSAQGPIVVTYKRGDKNVKSFALNS